MQNSDKNPNEPRQPVLNKANVSRRAGQIVPGSFADGIRMLNEKGALVVPVKLTKQRAIMLLDFIVEFKHDWYCRHEEGHHLEDDMQKTCQWLLNQINKRWSQNELHAPNKKRRRHDGKPPVIGSCCEITTKKRGFIYSDEECGNKAKIEIEYTLNNKYVKKQLCMKHYKSVTAWLDRIKVSYNCLYG